MASAPLLRLMALAHSASVKAGQIIREVMQKGDLGIVHKTKDDLYTIADTSAQKCIISSLSKKFPRASIIGEEDVSNIHDIPSEWKHLIPNEEMLCLSCSSDLAKVHEEDVTIWVDPLDGSRDFAKGLTDHVTVLIGVAVNERPVGGIIHQPFYKRNGVLGRTIWGMKGVGFGGFTVSPPDPGKFIVTTSRSQSHETERALVYLRADDIIRAGGAGFKAVLLLEGRAHAYIYPSPGCRRWDTCGPEAVLNAIGGVMSDTNGCLYDYSRDTHVINKKGVLAAYNVDLHQRCIDALKPC